MHYEETVKKLFEWNSKNLVHDALLQKPEIGNFFADSFLVIANGKHYDANHENYYEFLNQFRSTISSIKYDFGDLIFDPKNAVIPLQAHIIRTNGSKEDFEAILILKFNAEGKIILWHEVYLLI